MTTYLDPGTLKRSSYRDPWAARHARLAATAKDERERERHQRAADHAEGAHRRNANRARAALKER